MKKKVVVAMSGGVDSSVAAAVLKEEGFDVTGIMLKLWRTGAANNESGCCTLDAAEDARRVSQQIDIPFYVFNFADAFERAVIDPFIEDYANGRTPNPCVRCNERVKFSSLLERAVSLGADYLATGHYGRVESSGGAARGLLRAADASKDQSYVLYMLGQEELSRLLLPIGHLSKPQVRTIAENLNLRTAAKPESQEICFVPHGDLGGFLSERLPQASLPGDVIDRQGRKVGSHRGFGHYTVGQRRGLGAATGAPLYVREVIAASNTVVAGSAQDLLAKGIVCDEVSFVSGKPVDEGVPVSVATRYRGPEVRATIERVAEGVWKARFESAARRPAPGQAAVFYSGDRVMGGGTIREAF